MAISLACGTMKVLKRDMDDLVETCQREIPAAFESEDYSHRVEEVTKAIQAKRQAMTSELEEARKEGFALTFAQVGISPVPLLDGRPMTQEEFARVPDTIREELSQRADRIQHSITHAMQEFRRLGKEATERVQQVDAELVKFTLTPIIEELQQKYAQDPQVVGYLDQVQTDVAEHLEIFKPREDTPAAPPGFAQMGKDEDVFLKYRVNDLVDNSSCEGAPVILEYSPTYYNLFGRIDYRAHVGTLTTDLMMVKAGAVHRANGGYLVLQARDLLMSPLSWETLKRSLRSKEVRIENIGEQYSPLPSSTLRPQPVPLNAKIILVGSPDLLYMLQRVDEDFRRYFKVTADFDILMERSAENLGKYAAFVAAPCKESGLKPFHNTGVARIIDYSSRLVEDQEKLTTRFMDIADIITEANYWAGKNGSAVVTGEQVDRAIEQRRYRASLTEERIQELIEAGTIHISAEGKTAGQVNGLAIMSMGDYVFGKPSRITARVSLGRGQMINIERETQMSGKIHSKGFMILMGYTQGKYGQDKPLSLSASIGFEQTYSEVDGDSASSTELYALLSELSQLPIDQGIAVTGSVNQAGDIQAIGGATRKIEGFYDVCKAKGLTGSQGVMIPRDNMRNLVLEDSVINAVKEGRFHIYAVSTIDEGLEVLTGVPAGDREEDGKYPEGTVHHLVEKRLREMAQTAREYGRGTDGDTDADHEHREKEA